MFPFILIAAAVGLIALAGKKPPPPPPPPNVSNGQPPSGYGQA